MVLPSDSEGTPNVLLEGMVLHKIIVASKVGGVPEFVTEGQTGFLHQPKDPASFADAMERAYETPKEQLFAMLVNAKRLAEGEYSIRAMMEGFDKEYKSLEKVKEGIIGEQ